MIYSSRFILNLSGMYLLWLSRTSVESKFTENGRNNRNHSDSARFGARLGGQHTAEEREMEVVVQVVRDLITDEMPRSKDSESEMSRTQWDRTDSKLDRPDSFLA